MSRLAVLHLLYFSMFKESDSVFSSITSFLPTLLNSAVCLNLNSWWGAGYILFHSLFFFTIVSVRARTSKWNPNSFLGETGFSLFL